MTVGLLDLSMVPKPDGAPQVPQVCFGWRRNLIQGVVVLGTVAV